MLQSGGGNNTSAALLRQYFMHEQRCEEHSKRATLKSGGQSPRGNRTGILPVITSNTDIASLRRVRSKKQQQAAATSPRALMRHPGQSNYPLPFELPKHGIGFKVDELSPPTTADAAAVHKNVPSHGRAPPYGRRMITKEFFDEVSGGGIACLFPQQPSNSPRSARVAPAKP